MFLSNVYPILLAVALLVGSVTPLVRAVCCRRYTKTAATAAADELSRSPLDILVCRRTCWGQHQPTCPGRKPQGDVMVLQGCD